MHIRVGISVAAVLAGAGVGFACPAWADDPNGAYTVTWNDGTAPTTWIFTPCGSACSHVTGNTGWTLYFHGHSVGGTNPSLLEAMACAGTIAAHNNLFNAAVLENAACYFSSAEDVTRILEDDRRAIFAPTWKA